MLMASSASDLCSGNIDQYTCTITIREGEVNGRTWYDQDFLWSPCWTINGMPCLCKDYIRCRWSWQLASYYGCDNNPSRQSVGRTVLEVFQLKSKKLSNSTIGERN